MFIPINSLLHYIDNKKTLLHQHSLYCGQSHNSPKIRQLSTQKKTTDEGHSFKLAKHSKKMSNLYHLQ